MGSIYIARHGQDEDNRNGILNSRRDTPLTHLGVEQAHILAYAIKEKNIVFTASFSSPLQRAQYDRLYYLTHLGH